MLRSRTVNALRDLAAKGYSIRRIVRETGLARNTVRKYLRGSPEHLPRKKRRSKLDPFKQQILHWMEVDHLFNCETMLVRLRRMGYQGGSSILRDFVHPYRPAKQGRVPVLRYETGPGEQMQIDWGEFTYEEKGRRRRLYGFTAILSYSRMRFVCFFKRCDTTSLLRGLMAALQYFGGLPQRVLTDRMKSVLVSVEDGQPQWNSRYEDFMSSVGMIPRVCKPYTPQTKGKVERTISVIKQSFWPGVSFTDLHDLNDQAKAWCDHHNSRSNRTTGVPPVDRLLEELLAPLPRGFAWERFIAETRRVSWDGYVSYDGVLYGLPGGAAGTDVEVAAWGGQLSVWKAGRLLVCHLVRPRSGALVPHPDQFKDVLSASEVRRRPAPLGHLVETSPIVDRSLGDYDRLFQEVAA